MEGEGKGKGSQRRKGKVKEIGREFEKREGGEGNQVSGILIQYAPLYLTDLFPHFFFCPLTEGVKGKLHSQ